MIFRLCGGRIQEVAWNFVHHVVVTWRCTRGESVFKLYKIQTKSENHETCRCVFLSHVETVVKNWKSFEQDVTSDAWNPDISTWMASTCDNKTHRQVSCFHEMTTLTHAISCPLCSLRRRVRITHLRGNQAMALFLHQALSFPPTSSLFIFFIAWWTCDALWTTIDLWRWILDLLYLRCRVCEILCWRCDMYMWDWVCDVMDVLYCVCDASDVIYIFYMLCL
jgi:hypothetical protein